MASGLDLTATPLAQDIRQSWQGRALKRAKGKLSAVVLSVLSHNFDDAMPMLLRVIYPGFTSISAPFFCTAARIMRSGHIVADMVTADGQIVKNQEVFKDEKEMQAVFRQFADELKLKDEERVALFISVQKWVVADYRLDPNFDRRDPDAKRLVN